MSKRSEAGNGLAAVLLLLVVLVGGVAFNYHRSLEAEAQENRPYRGYSDEELSALLGAYEGRQETQTTAYEARAGIRVKAQGKGYFDEQVREFERVQRVHRKSATARDALAGTRVVLKEIKKEQGKRDSERDKVKLFVKRAFNLSL